MGDTDPDGRGSGEELGGVEGGETVTGCEKIIYFTKSGGGDH